MKHEVKSIPKEEILANRCSAYEFIDFDKQEKTNKIMKNVHVLQENIYITSDEEIKEGDWCLCSEELIHKVVEIKSNIGIIRFQDGVTEVLDACKKIILTTDELYIHNDLIPKEYNLFPQYIQKIDDEFLEWFVKNPSCEKVEVSYGILKPFQSTNKGYIIHLPDNDVLEKPKQEYERGITITHVDKQETFEETHQLCNTGVIIPKTTQQIIDEDFDGGLTMGEIIPKEETICIQTGLPCGMTCFSEEVCNRNVYTEEDVKNAFLDGWQLRDGDLPFPKAKKKWFNEFKNK